ncbi:8-oxo-dGTP pyrophosphatase MutT (NUDIX family) [Povalibacter uvarum]|uniref:8-oxo-dGTP pyrophosphatase MutT (NUDIX family) n=1 Tax=Povalibacter uvarum TaxID=732238 RepID=A0A841HIH1_9GAMM|nr:CoA pyrophosphatase [Povalibacter uvarum]MBB6092189.1 8-oxo-dGTP pyrophosphatase MutT (NUDIX family) [Povalibacter uvarum]
MIAQDRIALRGLIEEKLRGSRPPTDFSAALPGGMAPEATSIVRQFYPASPVPAAVLVPIIDREEGLSVLLTQRSAQLKNHAGQISFPGGKVELTDDGPGATALRETEEEIGLSRDFVQVVGYMEPHVILTGFWVTPVVGFVRPGFALKLDQREVDSAFEVPLSHVLDEANHLSRERKIGDASVQVYDIPFGSHRIWGATAGMLMAFYRLLRQA